MSANKAKPHNETSVPFSLSIAEGRILVNVNLPLRKTAIVVGTLVAPLVAELVKALLSGR